MKRLNKTTILISLATLVLAGVAVFTALRLYQLRDESVSPAAPESEPGAQTVPTIPPPSPPLFESACEDITFTITTADEPTPTSTSTSTPTPTATATTPGETTGPTPTATATTPGETTGPTPTATSITTDTTTNSPLASGPTSSPTASLPPAGYATPTLVGIGAGIAILLFSIFLAL